MSDSKYDEKTLRDLLDEAVSREEKRTPLQRAMVQANIYWVNDATK